MRISSPILICLLFASTMRAQEPPLPSPEVPYVEREEKQFNFYPGGKIAISVAVPGSIRIIGWQKGSVRVEAEKIVYYLSPEEAKAALKQHPMRVRWNQTSASVRIAMMPETNVEVNLTVYVPGDKTDIKADLERGDVSIDSINGWIETSTGEGSVETSFLSGYFSGTTRRGDILVEMSGRRWEGLEFAAMTQLGSVSLKLPVQFSAALQLETRDGKIAVDYPEQIVDGEPQPPDILINKSAQSLKATVGDGGAPIKLFTSSGDITFSKID
jgi:DUF4097 and DUF4098 domain-containing protein YvlB